MERHVHTHSIAKDSSHDTSHHNYFGLAFNATFHCLLGCGLGEVIGMMISAWLNLDSTTSIILALTLGAIGGLLLGLIPLLRAGFSTSRALKQVIVAEGLSIAVMETVELLVQVSMPGVMSAHLLDWLFWKGMLLGLLAGFIAAFPVNYIFVRRGIRHIH